MDRKERIIYWREQLRQIVRKDGATEAHSEGMSYPVDSSGAFRGCGVPE